MKIVSWNVNGIRAAIKKGFLDFVKEENPDIVCLQEIKADKSQVDNILKDYAFHFWNSADKKGYSGTAVFSKIKPEKVTFGKECLGDLEGRVMVLDFDMFYLVNVYTPNSQRGLARLPHRMEWDIRFFKFIKDLERKKPLIICGDFNVAHNEIDIARPKDNMKNAGFTFQEREGFSKYIDSGFVDAFRAFCNEHGRYSWWSQRFDARKRNIGWRIDYFLVSNHFMESVKNSDILDKVLGSDHAPVLIELN